jgi:hypothetical protein
MNYEYISTRNICPMKGHVAATARVLTVKS